MKTIMIHELSDEFTNFLKTLDEEYIFTFDDGLYSQYKYMIENKELLEKHKCIFFVTTNIICPEDLEQNEDFITSEDAHNEYFEKNDRTNFMTLAQIKELDTYANVEIGMHGYNHIKFGGTSIQERYEEVTTEVSSMIVQMMELGLNTDKFCFPYNFAEPLLRALLQRNGFTEFYGGERIDFFELFDVWNNK